MSRSRKDLFFVLVACDSQEVTLEERAMLKECGFNPTQTGTSEFHTDGCPTEHRWNAFGRGPTVICFADNYRLATEILSIANPDVVFLGWHNNANARNRLENDMRVLEKQPPVGRVDGSFMDRLLETIDPLPQLRPIPRTAVAALAATA